MTPLEKAEQLVGKYYIFSINKQVMQLIKLTDEHYVMVSDEPVTKGDWYISPSGGIISDHNGTELLPDGWKKITHSTQPLEDGTTIHGIEHKRWVQIKYIDLDEVKELIGEVDVEKKAEKFIGCKYDDIENNIDQIGYDSFIRGYNQALEDNKEKKYTEEDMKECVMSILRDLNTHNEIDKPVNFVWTDSFKKHIQSLQPKTEWEVEFIDSKLKLL